MRSSIPRIPSTTRKNTSDKKLLSSLLLDINDEYIQVFVIFCRDLPNGANYFQQNAWFVFQRPNGKDEPTLGRERLVSAFAARGTE